MTRAVLSASLALAAVAGCNPSPGAPAAASPAAAKVANAVKEETLASVTLSDKAEERLGVVAVAVARKPVSRTRTLGGEVVVPPGALVTVSAPLGGTLALPAGAAAPSPGAVVKAGEAVFLLQPILSPEARLQVAMSRVEAAGEVAQAKVRLESARTALARAERLLRDRAGSQRDVDEAGAQATLAEAAVKAAEARRDVLEKAVPDPGMGVVAPIPVVSPLSGILSRLHVAPGQLVSSGGALFDVLDARRLWVRVPVYVGDLETFVTDGEARVGSLAAKPGSPAVAARPVAAPPSARPDAATADLHYALDNADGALRPGQKVGVTIPLKDPAESLVIPWSAVVHDIHGGAWVYERVQPRTFVRRRVQVRHVVGAEAVLAEGPAPGTPVVTAGAMEIFGTEFGTGK